MLCLINFIAGSLDGRVLGLHLFHAYGILWREEFVVWPRCNTVWKWQLGRKITLEAFEPGQVDAVDTGGRLDLCLTADRIEERVCSRKKGKGRPGIERNGLPVVVPLVTLSSCVDLDSSQLQETLL